MTAPNVIFAWPIRGEWEMQSGNWDCICDGMEPDQVSYTRTDTILSDPRVKALVEAVEAAFACGMIPKSTASEGGANKFSEQVRVADQLRAAMKGLGK